MGALILSPHLDDEVLGCASFLDQPDTTLCYVTHLHPAFPDGTTVRENEALIEWLDLLHQWIVKPPVIRLSMPASILDTLPSHDLFEPIEKMIERVKPDTVLIPYPGYNQDHRAVYEAAITAMRPNDQHHVVKRILIYEQIDVFATMRKVEPFRATYFRPLDMAFKAEAMGFYASQLRGHRTMEQLEAMARVRGYQANMEFAEAFEVVRWIES